MEEPIDIRHNYETSIEFVARSVGYNDQVVETKSTATPGIETNIYSCYFLVYDTTPTTGGGNLIYCSDNLISGTDPVQAIPTQRLNISKKGVEAVKACFIVNVPRNFIYNETDGTPLLNNLTALNAAVLGPDHFSYATNSDTVPMGTPQMTINGVSGVKCIPAFGLTPNDINLANGTVAPVQITIKRLFAKVSVNLKLQVDLDNWLDDIVGDASYFQLSDYQVNNIPTKVKLVESQNESSWVESSGTNFTSGRLNNDHRIYNRGGAIEFDFYVPEYYLTELSEEEYYNIPEPNRPAGSYGDQRFKPLCFDAQKKPVYIFLTGSYSQYSYNTTNLQYKVYLGKDAAKYFSLERNINYFNYLTIKNVNQSNTGTGNNLDHRVTTQVINNPVALAGKSANCYVINALGKYNFPAYKGAYNNLTQAVLCNNPKAKLVEIANDNLNNIKLDSLWYDVDKNIVSFKVINIANGNVVIGLVDDKDTEDIKDDEIEWSWHLWFNNEYNGTLGQWAQIQTQTMPDGTTSMIDRNLGAAPSFIESISYPGTAIGTYYKYGCKEPFIGGDYKGGGTLYDSDGNPISDWSGNTKSPTDPCPPGYRVPVSTVWNENTGENALGNFSYSPGIYYPYSNYLLSDKNPNPDKTDYIPFYNGYPFNPLGLGRDGTVKLEFKISVLWWEISLGSIDVPALCRNEYIITDMKIQTSKDEGRLWCTDGFFSYKHNVVNLLEIFNGGVEALRNKLQINEYTHTRTKVKKYGLPSTEDEIRKLYEQMSNGQFSDAVLESLADWDDPKPVNPPQMTSDDMDELLGRIILFESETINQTGSSIVTESFNRTEGYQVRCVLETE